MKKSNLLVLLPIVALASCGGETVSSSSSLNSYVTYSDEIKSIMMKLLKKDKNGLIVGSILYLFSNVLSIFITDKIGLVASVFLIRGFANAFAIVRNVTYVQHLVGDKKVARALTLCAGFANAVNGLGNLLSSTIYQAWSFQGLFFILLIVQIGGFVILLTIKEEKPKLVVAPSPETIGK